MGTTRLPTGMGFRRTIIQGNMKHFWTHGNCRVIYEEGAPSKNNQQAEADHASFGRKKKWGGSDSPPNSEKGFTGNRKRNDAGHPSDAPTGAKNTYLLHVPGHSSKECKFLKDYSENHVAQWPFKNKQARSSGNKRSKIVNFESASEEANIIKSHDEPIPRKKKVKVKNKKTKIDQANADP